MGPARSTCDDVIIMHALIRNRGQGASK
jgi:hypothetical protein